ncbi:hypothetical protein RSOL_045660 [Rhizoctonia solani AG-3 Rhs1AP]|uniref:Uncharacterized protein n=1 Tax=Rhizoctonia solani AG-3 Rhs1AP TaxID=1086054 RepID=X8IZE2_9AGAM|nr:hypothetical protein RSOL_045660 [Rhizoctonia solani AG-3 Rhs1AP]
MLLRFSEEFFDPTDDISKWHDQQQSSRFRTIQYRKERTGVGHEFILLLLQKEQGGDVDCYCRIERVGDPQHLAQVVCIDGTIAEDYIQAIPLSDPVSANLIDNSDVVAEITFPQTFMLRDVLAICYGISNHYRAKRYTLQQYNCYFFSWSLILALARGCMNWDVSPSIPEHVNNMHDRIMQSIYDQGPARFRSSAYILSNKTFANHENEQHPLDQALSSRLCRSGFTDSITTALKDVLWADRLHIRLIENIDGELVELASESVDLTTCDESQSEGMNSPVTQDKRDLDFEYALGSLTQKAALVVLEGVFQVNSQVVAGVFPTSALFKQRLGHEVWCKELARGLRHPGRLFSRVDEEVPSCEPANPHGHQPTSSSIRDLCFIPPAVLLGFSARLMFTCGFTLGMCVGGVVVGLTNDGALKKNIFKYMVLGGKIIVRSAVCGIGSIPRNYAASKHMILWGVGRRAARRLDPAAYGLLDKPVFDEMRIACMKCYCQAVEFFDTGFRELTKDKEYPLDLLRPLVTSSIHAMMYLFRTDFRTEWVLILWHRFMDIITRVAERELEGLIGQANAEKGFRVRKSDNELSQVGVFNLDSHGGVAQTVKISKLVLSCDAPVTSRDGDVWSHQDLQHYIRQRISQLSKRETSFAPYLKRIPFLKSPEVCQKEIEVTMEEIWIASSPLMKPQSYTA